MQVKIKRFNKLKYTLKSITKNPKKLQKKPTTNFSIISSPLFNA